MQGVRFVEKAIESEILRQYELLESGQEVKPQTRRYDVNLDQTVLLREKEADLDYRFMYDPDLPSYHILPELINDVKHTIGYLPFDFKYAFPLKYL